MPRPEESRLYGSLVSVQLDDAARQLLRTARIGMLALASGTSPIVNPAAFTYQSGSVWMTTSRYAAKLGMARKDPRASFIVEAGGRSVQLQGVLEVFDLRSVRGAVRAAFEGPNFGFSMAGYALKNAAFIGGYLVDLAGLPREWWPQNRLVLRLSPDRVSELDTGTAEAAHPSRLPGAPERVGKAVENESEAFLCWMRRGYPQLAPALWVADGDDVLAWVPEELAPPHDDIAATLVVEYHHPYRATRMIGACPRGPISSDPAAVKAVERRYDMTLRGGVGLRLATQRVTWWQGFEVKTTPVGVKAPSVLSRSEGTGGRRGV